MRSLLFISCLTLVPGALLNTTKPPTTKNEIATKEVDCRLDNKILANIVEGVKNCVIENFPSIPLTPDAWIKYIMCMLDQINVVDKFRPNPKGMRELVLDITEKAEEYIFLIFDTWRELRGQLTQAKFNLRFLRKILKKLGCEFTDIGKALI